MHAGLLDGGVDRLGDDLAGAGMGGMALDDDGAAGGQGRGGITAGGREGQREVRGAEDGDRADGALDQTDFRAGRGLAIRHGGVEATVEELALLDVIGEQAELAGGAAALALQAGDRQAGFLGADLGGLLGAGPDLVRAGAPKGGANRARGIALHPEGFPGGLAGAGCQRNAAGGRMKRPGQGRLRRKRARAIQPLAGDEMFSLGDKGHVTFLSQEA